ncbi:MAG: FRG domain-containing protein [Gammaproteobacteria bacterium]
MSGNPHYDLYESKPINSWEELVDYYEENRTRFDGWLFRGQGDAKWCLEPTFTRAVITRFKESWLEVPKIERGLVRLFRRQLHSYSEEALFQPSTLMECLALMQHYGAPTRLLDWTY